MFQRLARTLLEGVARVSKVMLMVFVLFSGFVLSSSLRSTQATAGVGYWIIVEGASFHKAQSVITYGCTQVYNILLGVGYTSDRIRYVAEATIATFTLAIAWGASKATSSEPLWIYMFDHGTDSGAFGFRNGEFIYYSQINTLLNELIEPSSNISTYMIIAACFSGMAIADLSSTGRMIITSCNSTEESSFNIPGRTWEAFSDPFWEQIAQYAYVKDAFNYACLNIKDVQGLNQTPLLDDNGDLVGHTGPLTAGGDGDLAGTLHIGLHAYIGPSVGGDYVPISKFALLAPYVGLASTVSIVIIATAIWFKRANRRKQKQEP